MTSSVSGQTRNDGDLCGAIFSEFFAFKPEHALLFVIPAFAGMTNGDYSRESWARKRAKGGTQNRVRKQGAIPGLPKSCKQLYSIRGNEMNSLSVCPQILLKRIADPMELSPTRNREERLPGKCSGRYPKSVGVFGHFRIVDLQAKRTKPMRKRVSMGFFRYRLRGEIPCAIGLEHPFAEHADGLHAGCNGLGENGRRFRGEERRCFFAVRFRSGHGVPPGVECCLYRNSHRNL